MDETKLLANRCLNQKYGTLESATVDRAKYFLLDYIGVAVRGALSDSSKPVHHMISKLSEAGGDAAVIGTSLKASPGYAAIANGTAAHSLEMDDVTNEASLHPGAVIFSAAFDCAFLTPVSGRHFIEAIVAGYEAMIRLGVCLNPSAHYRQGFHPTSTCGTFGAAVTAGHLLGLNADEMVNALGIAGSQTAGSMEFLKNGAFTKRFHPGWAAHAGIVAAVLAKYGFSGPDTIIEGQNGFLNAYSNQADPTSLFLNWGRPYKIERTSVKPHACCRYIQGPLDCILEIVQRHKLKATDIKTVTVSMLRTGIPIVAEPKETKYNPKSIVDAQFSMPFGAAVMILYRKATLDEYVEKNLHSPQVHDLMSRVVCVQDEEIEIQFPRQWPAKVAISTMKGETYSKEIIHPKGDPENALTWEEMKNKFHSLTEPVFTNGKKNEILERVMSLENEKSIRDFAEILSS